MQIKTKIVSGHTADSKLVKQEVNGTVILSPLVFRGKTFNGVRRHQLDEGDSERPHIRPDVVIRFVRIRRIDPFRRHVSRASGAPSLGFGID